MASSITEGVQRNEQDGNQKRYITSLHSVEASECATALVNSYSCIKEKEESGVPDQHFTGPTSSTWYYSARIQGMIEKSGEFSSEMEFNIESSRVHHSEVDTTIMSQTQRSGKTNRECFEVLKRRKYVRKGGQIVSKQYDEKLDPSLFEEWDALVMGEKITEGGQVEIYETSAHGINHIVKVGGQFALVMWKCWRDLRKLIDQRMMQSHNQGPPFTPKQVVGLMYQIAEQMNQLHRQHPPILHKDLKAANVLV